MIFKPEEQKSLKLTRFPVTAITLTPFILNQSSMVCIYFFKIYIYTALPFSFTSFCFSIVQSLVISNTLFLSPHNL